MINSNLFAPFLSQLLNFADRLPMPPRTFMTASSTTQCRAFQPSDDAPLALLLFTQVADTHTQTETPTKPNALVFTAYTNRVT